jgi:ELWxxDGT repeat protein
MVKDVNDGYRGGEPFWLTSVDGTVFFSATSRSHGRALWSSDGTRAGTRLVDDLNPEGNSTPEWLTEFGSTLLFSANDGTHGRELWKLEP